MRSDLTVSV